jgi:L-fuconate dehydratase
MTGHITGFDVVDVRFPTSRDLDGSDAMNADPDYSAAYLVLTTDLLQTDGTPLRGYGLAFTIGRGNDVQAAAIDALRGYVLGATTDAICDTGDLYRQLQHDSQLRWLGPEKGVMQMAIAAVVNAAWDLRARLAGLPLWQLLGRLDRDEIIDQVDFRYLSDALTPAQARDLLDSTADGRAERERLLLSDGYPAYTTTPGWLGYSDEKLVRLAKEAVADGFGAIKLKVGADVEDDVRRLTLARDAVGHNVPIAIDANQRWDVSEAVDWIQRLAHLEPFWIEEPTSPDDILGHAAIRRGISPIRVATGEHIANRVVFKQLMQAQAIDVVQIDACRVAGVNENIAILLLAKQFGLPVCPHAGGVGLCEMVRHLSMFDFVAVSGSLENRYIEFVDHLHEHFVDPAVIVSGAYAAPAAPGMSAEMFADSVEYFRFPDGKAWTEQAS